MKSSFALGASVVATFIASPVAAQTCPSYTAGDEITRLTDDRIDEASGLARSWVNDGLFWTHNDSGDSARVFVIDLQGETRAVVDLPDADAVDYEDIAIGPCAPDDMTPCVWVGDIGDNDEIRENITLYRFVEPTIPENAPDSLSIAEVTRIDVTYEGGPRNAETLMVHPTTGAVYIVDKTVGDPSYMWSVPTDGTPATQVATASLGEVGVISNRITGGDFAPSGDEFTIRTYTHVYTFCGEDPATAFEGTPTSIIGTHLFQSEALTYSADGQTIYTTTEVQRDEQPKVLAMRNNSPTPAGDMGSGEVPDAGPAPAADAGSTAPDAGESGSTTGGGTSVVIIEDEERQGCSCSTGAPVGSAGSFLLLVLGFFGLRTRPRRT